jgi:DNA-binding transcriptional regulator YiaG
MSRESVDTIEKFPYPILMTPEQCRAARGWLGWTQQELAGRAHVGLSTVRDFEAGRRQPIGNNLAAMEKALVDAGISLLYESGRAVGIRLSPDAHDC